MNYKKILETQKTQETKKIPQVINDTTPDDTEELQPTLEEDNMFNWEIKNSEHIEQLYEDLINYCDSNGLNILNRSNYSHFYGYVIQNSDIPITDILSDSDNDEESNGPNEYLD